MKRHVGFFFLERFKEYYRLIRIFNIESQQIFQITILFIFLPPSSDES